MLHRAAATAGRSLYALRLLCQRTKAYLVMAHMLLHASACMQATRVLPLMRQSCSSTLLTLSLSLVIAISSHQLYKYQEQSQLLDGFLEDIVLPLSSLLRTHATNLDGHEVSADALQRIMGVCSLLSVLVVVRGYKTVVK